MSIPLLSAVVIISYKSIISPLIETITSTKNLIMSISSKNVPENISEKLKSLDILHKVEIINLFLSELETYNSDTDEQKQTHFMKTFGLLIKNITFTIETIKTNLKIIQN